MSTVGTKNYNGQDWFWPHDYRHYLRDANARERKLIHNGWLKIGVPVKKSGLKISDSYLEPKKNQLKKAWDIVRKVVAPKELGQPIPESVNEAKYKGYDYKRQNRKDGLPLIVPALQKTFSNMKDLKKYIDKHGTMEGLGDKFSKRLAKYNKKNKKSRDAMKKYAKVKKIKLKGRGVYQDYDGLDEAGMEINKLKDAILMFQKKINKQGMVTNARDEEHLKKLIKLYKQMGGKGVKESVNEFNYNLYQKLSDKQKVAVHLISKGNKPNDAKKMVNKYYDKVSKMYKKASLSKKAEIISSLSATNEGSCGYGIDGKLGKEPAGSHLLKKKKKYDSTSVNESRQGIKIYNEFEVLLRDFEKEFLSLSAQAGRVTYKGDEKILRKELKKHIVPLYDMIRSWGRTAQRDD